MSFSSAGNYTITLSMSSGTTVSIFENSIFVNALPSITISANSFTTCITSNSPLEARPINFTASGGLSYTWLQSPSNPIGPSQTAQPTSNTCYSVTGEDANGCTATAVACITVIPRFTINVSPTNTYVCRDLNGTDLTFLTADNPSAPAYGQPSSHTYTWSGLGLASPRFQSTVYAAPFSTTSFTAQIRDSLGCISLPAISTVSVFICVGISKYKHNEVNFSIHPNPASDLLNIYIQSSIAGKVQVQIFSLLGQCFKDLDFEGNEIEVSTSELPKGAYFLKLTSSDGIKTIKFIKD